MALGIYSGPESIMFSPPHNQRAPLEDWQTAELRLTAFPIPSAQTQKAGWWHRTVGQAPETTTYLKSGIEREEGPFNGGKLTLSIEPLVIHWRFVPSDEALPLEQSFPTIGPFSDSLRDFLDPMHRWLTDSIPNLQRLAFGAVLLLPVADRAAGYARLSSYLPGVAIDPINSRDFLYQINRRRGSNAGIPDLRINRLSKWSVLAVATAVVEVGPALRQFTTPEHYACGLELDINTVPEYPDVISRDELDAVFQELVELGTEIVTEGDVP